MKRNHIWVLFALLVVMSLGLAIVKSRSPEPALPTASHDLPYTLTLENLSSNSGVYTEYYFTPASGALHIQVDLSGSDDGAARQAKISLFLVNAEDVLDSVTTEAFSGSTQLSHTFYCVSSDSAYYLRVENISGNSLFADRAIDGVVEIRES